MSVTIIDVAKKANVSISTVSKYLNGGSIREKNRQKIAQAIHDLNYHPNRAAQGLRGDRSYQIGLLINDLKMPYMADLTKKLVDSVAEKGYHIIITSHRDEEKRAERAISFLLQQQVDGILYVPIRSEHYLEEARRIHLPMVALDRQESFPCDMVGCNSSVATYEATEHLIKNGHREIAIITGTLNKTSAFASAEERLTGYIRAHEDYHLPVKKEFLLAGDFSNASGYRCIQQLLQLSTRPTAVLVTNYDMVLGAVTALNKYEIRIPEELSFVAFDDLPCFQALIPQLTSIRQPTSQIAMGSINLLLQRIAGDFRSFPEYRRYPCTLISRDSVRNLYPSI